MPTGQEARFLQLMNKDSEKANTMHELIEAFITVYGPVPLWEAYKTLHNLLHEGRINRTLKQHEVGGVKYFRDAYYSLGESIRLQRDTA